MRDTGVCGFKRIGQRAATGKAHGETLSAARDQKEGENASTDQHAFEPIADSHPTALVSQGRQMVVWCLVVLNYDRVMVTIVVVITPVVMVLHNHYLPGRRRWDDR